MALYELGDKVPNTPQNGDFWVAPAAHVVGDVHLGEGVGIWFGAVLRGDNERLTIGARTNVQEHAMVHADPGFPAQIGENVTIGHRAIVHGCTIGDNTLIGMGATVLNGAKIGRNCLIGAGALVTEGKEIPDGSLVIGSPAKVVRALDDAAIAGLKASATNYVANAKRFTNELKRID
ncbi:gamma carbonic anhydrase family protein [Actibacterium lipolyticum]|uniref:2,3,4,5-tetrahydropyridine-2,6-dicarboxylate N-acetyltransferase n=1 Tax=Actibacterium lipolyticum TaxID=1524263 RepID=A0A238L9T7_9RHOB|nr:gamma carbonic anhydrase family protein [Actibacterium lipolyticum]SMX51076.1 2,3,4,5-tetrahydropyridine-2,6-dicarboxylate N-acetyltransferase [Actibacterium lipolyticum]